MSVDAKILAALRGQGGCVRVEELAQHAGIGRDDLQARIAQLRKLGYEIEATPHQGFTLAAAPDELNRDDLLSLLANHRTIGRDIQVFSQTTSTNDLAERFERDGVAEGVVVFAEAQTKGRGRLGRSWFSPPGKGLWFSVLLRPNAHPQSATQLTVAAAISLVRAIREQTGLRAEIKWPNDVIIGGRKVAGVLTEMSAELDRIHYMVLGIGVDVNLTQSELPPDLREMATSLQIETGKSWRRADLAAVILRELDNDYERIRKGGFAQVAEEWEEACSTLGQQITVRVGDRTLRGRAESLDADGALLLRTEHGHLERIVGGDVSLN